LTGSNILILARRTGSVVEERERSPDEFGVQFQSGFRDLLIKIPISFQPGNNISVSFADLTFLLSDSLVDLELERV